MQAIFSQNLSARLRLVCPRTCSAAVSRLLEMCSKLLVLSCDGASCIRFSLTLYSSAAKKRSSLFSPGVFLQGGEYVENALLDQKLVRPALHSTHDASYFKVLPNSLPYKELVQHVVRFCFLVHSATFVHILVVKKKRCSR